MGPASGPGDEARPELAIIHYWSIVHSLSTNGLARLCALYLRLRLSPHRRLRLRLRDLGSSIVSG